MKTLLLLTSSLFTENGQSSLLARRLAERWLAAHPDGRIRVRDLAANPVPHLTAERFGAFTTRPEQRSVEQQAVVDFSDALIDELREADEIVLTLPMYNFGIPSTLKAYIDHVVRAGVTFQYTANGPIGLLDDKKVHVVATRGGYYAGTQNDTSTRYLRDILAFIGLRSVDFVFAEGLNIGAEQRAAGLAAAREQIEQLFRTEADRNAA